MTIRLSHAVLASIEPQTPNTKYPDMVRFEMFEQVAFTDRKDCTDVD